MQPSPTEPALPTPFPLRLGEPTSSFTAGMCASATPPATLLPSSYQGAPPLSPLRSGDLPDAMARMSLAATRRVPALQTELRAVARSQVQRTPQVRPPSSVFTPEQLQPAQVDTPPNSAILQAQPEPCDTPPTLLLFAEQLHDLALLLEVEPLDGDSLPWIPPADFLDDLVSSVQEDVRADESAVTAPGIPLPRSLVQVAISPMEKSWRSRQGMRR